MWTPPQSRLPGFASDINFKLTHIHPTSRETLTTLVPYQPPGLCLQGVTQEAVKHLKKALHIAPPASITMLASWKEVTSRASHSAQPLVCLEH